MNITGINLFWNIIFIATLSQALFVTVTLFVQYFRKKKPSQLILSAFILVFSAILLNNLVYWNQAFDDYPHFLLFSISIRFLLAPLFYFYCKTFIKGRFGKRDLLHFLPFIIITLIYLPFFFLSGDDKIQLMNIAPSDISDWRTIVGANIKWLISLQLIAYPLVIYAQINTFLKKGNGSISHQKINQKRWLLFINSLFLIYGLLMFFYFILVSFQIGGIEKDYYISLIMSILIYAISYIGMMNSKLLKGEHFLEKIQQLKYKKTPLNDGYLEEIVVKLDHLMEQQKTYLNPEINLNEIAQQSGIQRHHISQALSLQSNKTFPEFINFYRIEHACNLLTDLSEEDNIKTVMYNSGFNNRVSFNNNFKKFKKMTPSQYLNKLRIKE